MSEKRSKWFSDGCPNPNCKEDDVDYVDEDWHSGKVIRRFNCGCGWQWDDTYVYDHTDLVKTGEQE